MRKSLAKKPPPTWAYGITTVSDRVDNPFPATLASLESAGFCNPRIFIDGGGDKEVLRKYETYDCPITNRREKVGALGNWILALWELYIREPTAQRFTIFQDDILVCKGLRDYLDTQGLQKDSYWNLIVYPVNEKLKPSSGYRGWYRSDQMGRGAQALVFDLTAVIEILKSDGMVGRPQDLRRGKQNIDGVVLNTLKSLGYVEYVHSPGLVTHLAVPSAIRKTAQPEITEFVGTDFDAMELVK